MHEAIEKKTRYEELSALLECLPDHWSVMRVTRMGAETWRVYDNSQNLVADADDIVTALNLALT